MNNYKYGMSVNEKKKRITGNKLYKQRNQRWKYVSRA